jgi:hypothetical protein
MMYVMPVCVCGWKISSLFIVVPGASRSIDSAACAFDINWVSRERTRRQTAQRIETEVFMAWREWLRRLFDEDQLAIAREWKLDLLQCLGTMAKGAKIVRESCRLRLHLTMYRHYSLLFLLHAYNVARINFDYYLNLFLSLGVNKKVMWNWIWARNLCVSIFLTYFTVKTIQNPHSWWFTKLIALSFHSLFWCLYAYIKSPLL